MKKCSNCDETKNLAIHHINKRHYDNHPENRILLCDFCHTAQHIKGFKRFDVGEIGFLGKEKGFRFNVRVENIKSVFGMVRYLVSPIAGKGRIFTQKLIKS